MLQNFVHYTMHFIVPIGISYGISSTRWKRIYIVFLGSMLIDLDHLLATPIFDPARCSIGYHPLHSYWAIGLYMSLLLPQRTRILAIALLFHIATDALDCAWLP